MSQRFVSENVVHLVLVSVFFCFCFLSAESEGLHFETPRKKPLQSGKVEGQSVTGILDSVQFRTLQESIQTSVRQIFESSLINEYQPDDTIYFLRTENQGPVFLLSELDHPGIDDLVWRALRGSKVHIQGNMEQYRGPLECDDGWFRFQESFCSRIRKKEAVSWVPKLLSIKPYIRHDLDVLTKARQILWPKLSPIVEELFGGYTTLIVKPDERVGVVPLSVQEVGKILKNLGFGREPVAALKMRSTGHPSAGSWTKKQEHFQIHVTLFDLKEGTEVNAHREYRWEPDIGGNPEADYKHYDASEIPDYVPDPLVRTYMHYWTIGVSKKDGIEYVRTLFEKHDVPFQPPDEYQTDHLKVNR